MEVQDQEPISDKTRIASEYALIENMLTQDTIDTILKMEQYAEVLDPTTMTDYIERVRRSQLVAKYYNKES